MGAIVLSMHDGAVAGGDFNSGANPSGPALDLALRVSPDIDAIVTGHWHTRFTMMLPDPNGVPRPFGSRPAATDRSSTRSTCGWIRSPAGWCGS
ncbi:hypothetical protein ACFXKW_27095 [Streptomyces sp. NPDC059193]|uniref:hypothetical protein n=1 Tax=Streptomyces sp. NPDC059193 TaxID=3346763 RepID=UPI0036A1AF2A